MAMPTVINGESYLTIKEATRRLGISRQALDHLVETGRLRKYRQGFRRTVFFKESDIDDLQRVRPVEDEEE